MPLPPGLTQPPPPPQEVTAQMGIGQGLQAVANAQPGANPNPHASLLAQADAVKAVLEQMAQLEPVFAPFARSAISSIANGVSAVSVAPPMGGPQELPPALPAPGGGMQYPTLG